MTQRGFVLAIFAALALLVIVAYGNAVQRSCADISQRAAPLEHYFGSAARRADERAAIDVGAKRRLDLQSARADRSVVSAEADTSCSVLP